MPPPEALLGGSILGALTAYAVLGGADFGGGVWDLFARGPRQAEQRRLIAHALAPVWEVNHVWLIVALVLLFTGFPRAFAFVGESLHVPLVALLLGIVGRGSAFAFRAFDVRGDRVGQRWGRVFSVSSLLSPLLLGATVGALASGRLVPGSAFAWVSPFSVVTGLFALALFAFLAAVYLCAEADGPDLRESFRTRALVSGVIVAAMAALVLAISSREATVVFHGLLRSRWALLLHGATAIFALTTFAALLDRRFELARLTAAGQVGLIVLGWGASQYPYLVVPSFTLADAARPETLRLALLVLPLGGALLLPSLWLLFRVFKLGRA